MSETVLITGASGLIGKPLTALLLQNGYAVTHLSRTAKSGVIKTYAWDTDKMKIDPEAVATADHIIHLAGAPIAEKRLTETRKKEITGSRVNSTRLLAEEIRRQNKILKTFVSSSAIGYYGMITGDHIYKENDAPSGDFLGECCRLWEEAAQPVGQTAARLVIIRVGVVFSSEGGALQQMAAPVRWLAGAPLGNGKHWVPWIHMDDMCGIFLKAVQDKTMTGVYNAAAPGFATNRTITKAIGSALRKPVFLPPVPRLVLAMMLGKEIAQMVTTGSRISCEKIMQAGYKFKFPELEPALKNLLG
ncbi:MAG: protein of unknown function DUF1731 [Bacteroidetes bacterium]|nr:MAG: protein of unknown function DUF1731 [Bacteroidota bacterium]